jgi:hypothetical protein
MPGHGSERLPVTRVDRAPHFGPTQRLGRPLRGLQCPGRSGCSRNTTCSSVPQGGDGVPDPHQRGTSPPEQGRWLASDPARTRQLLRRARQQRGAARLPPLRHRTLVSGAAAPQPALAPDVGTDAAPPSSMATLAARRSSPARRPLRRSHPREEPSALAVHAGICAGGVGQPASLPRSSPTSALANSAVQRGRAQRRQRSRPDRTTRQPERMIAFPESDRPDWHRGTIGTDGTRSRRVGHRDDSFSSRACGRRAIAVATDHSCAIQRPLITPPSRGPVALLRRVHLRPVASDVDVKGRSAVAAVVPGAA